MLKMAQQQYIKHLYEMEEKSFSDIAKTLNINYRTARKYALKDDWNDDKLPKLEPESYPVLGEFIPIILGGHHLIIKAVKEMLSKNGKEMIVVYVDTAPGDSQPGLFGQEFASDIRPAKAWPRAGRMYIVVTDDNGNCSRSFKSFVTSVEKSNWKQKAPAS